MPRITVRLDNDLYTRLWLYARGRNDTSPEVSDIVRKALTQYLYVPQRQKGVSDNLAPRKERA